MCSEDDLFYDFADVTRFYLVTSGHWEEEVCRDLVPSCRRVMQVDAECSHGA